MTCFKLESFLIISYQLGITALPVILIISSLSLYLYVLLSLSLSFSLYVPLFLCLCQSLSLFLIFLTLTLSLSLSFSLSVYLSVSFFLSDCLKIPAVPSFATKCLQLRFQVWRLHIYYIDYIEKILSSHIFYLIQTAKANRNQYKKYSFDSKQTFSN